MSAPTIKVPSRACVFELDDDAVSLRLADGDGKNAKPTFEMLANSGKPILGHWFWGNLGIDLAGIKCKKRMPELKDHDSEQRLGFSTSAEVASSGLLVRGELMPSSLVAQQVRQESLDGFPWQASVSLRPTKVERLEDGQTAEVNGYTVKGPGHVIRKSECREVSFTAFGADSETSASALAAKCGDIEVQFSNPRNEAMTTPTDPAAKPPAVPDLSAERAAASSAALTAERTRANAILAAATPEQSQMAAKLVADGVDLADALGQLNADLRKRLEAATARLAAKPPSDAPLSGGNAEDSTGEKQTPLAAANALPDGPEKWAAQFAADPAIRTEFASAAAYAAFMGSPAPRGSAPRA